jgi:thiamine biosynthesis lipoprotein
VHGFEVSALITDYWSQRELRSMGCRAHLIVGDADDALLDWAGAELERLEQCWSRFRDDSELAHVHNGAGTWVAVSPALLLAFTCAADLHRATAGRFDPTIRAALEAAGYDRTFECVAADATDNPPNVHLGAAPGFDCVEIDAARARVHIPVGVSIDFGGLGKGLAADLVARGLVQRGARSALVNLGGDMRACGEAPDGAWTIPVEHPLDPSHVAFHQPLADGALVTSTTRIRAWHRGGVQRHHIVDPATGDSTRTTIVAVVAAAADAFWAEGIAKAIIVAGAEDGFSLAPTNGVRTWCFLENGNVVEA